MLLRKAVFIFGGLGIALAAATAVSAATFEIVPSVSDDHTTVTAEIAISPSEGETAAAFNGYTLKLGYDSSILEPVATETKDVLGDDLYAVNNLTDLSGVFVADNVVSETDSTKSCVALGWASAENKSTAEKLKIAKVSFKVVKSADTEITLDVTALAKSASELDSLITADTNDASGDVKLGASVLKGDVNSDEKINTKDVILLRQFLAKWPTAQLTEEQQNAANVNGDDKVNTKDVIRLRQYLAKWPGVTLE